MKITFPNLVGNIEIYLDCLRAICGETHGKSMLDIGCAFAPNTPKLGFARRTYIDVIDRKLDHPEEQQFFFRDDLRSFLPAIRTMAGLKFDVTIASDVIEHLYPDDGRKLVLDMTMVSHKQIIFTPLGEIFKLHTPSSDDPEAHHSLWTPEDFPGWASIVFPKYHERWGGGGFFSFRCEGLQQEYERVYMELISKPWVNGTLMQLG